MTTATRRAEQCGARGVPPTERLGTRRTWMVATLHLLVAGTLLASPITGAGAVGESRTRRQRRARPRRRPHDPDHPLRGDERRRRLQEHDRRGELGGGEHGADDHRRPRPRPRPHDAHHPLRGDDDGGVFKSTDAGGTLGAVNTGLTTPLVYALALDPTTPTTLYAGTWAAASSRARRRARAGRR